MPCMELRGIIPVTCYSGLTSRSVSQADRTVVRLAVSDTFGTGFGANTRALCVLLRARYEKARRHEVTSRWVTRHGPALSSLTVLQRRRLCAPLLLWSRVFHCAINAERFYLNILFYPRFKTRLTKDFCSTNLIECYCTNICFIRTKRYSIFSLTSNIK